MVGLKRQFQGVSILPKAQFNYLTKVYGVGQVPDLLKLLNQCRPRLHLRKSHTFGHFRMLRSSQ